MFVSMEGDLEREEYAPDERAASDRNNRYYMGAD
jgi:hypothetical protein